MLVVGTGADDRRWERRAAFGGIVFVVLSVCWAALIGDAPGVDSSRREMTSFYGEEDKRLRLWLGGLALTFAGLFFAWFLGSLRTLLRRAEGEPGRLSAVAFGGGLVMIGLLFVKNAVKTSIAATIAFGERFQLDPGVVKVMDGLYILLLGHEGVAAAIMIGFASVVAVRTGVFPAWLAWAGAAVAVLSIFTVVLFAIPLVLVLLWVLAVSVLILRGGAAARSAPET